MLATQVHTRLGRRRSRLGNRPTSDRIVLPLAAVHESAAGTTQKFSPLQQLRQKLGVELPWLRGVRHGERSPISEVAPLGVNEVEWPATAQAPQS